jgi:hypothetical protein
MPSTSDVRDQAEDAREQERVPLVLGQHAADEPEEQHHEAELDGLDAAELRERPLDHGDPVVLLLFVEEVPEPDHRQERAAERRHRDVRARQVAGVLVGVRRGEDERGDRADVRDDRHDDQRKHDPHAEDGDRDAPRDEAPAPDRIHALEHGRVHDGVVERERHSSTPRRRR